MEAVGIMLLLQGVIQPDRNAELISVAARVANETFAEHVSAIFWCDTHRYEAASFLEQYTGAVLTTPADAPEESIRNNFHAEKYLQLIILVNSTLPFQRFLTIISGESLNPLRVILILLADATSTQIELKNIMRTAWVHNVTDVLAVSVNDRGEIELSTFMPYGNGICGDVKPVILNGLTKNLFPRKFINFYGCPVKVGMTLDGILPFYGVKEQNGVVVAMEGMVGRQFGILERKLNASFQAIVVPKTENLKDALASREVDIVFPTSLLIAERMVNISSIYITRVYVACYGPIQREVHAWARVLLPFANEMTIYIAVSFTMFVIATKLVRRFSLSKPERSQGIAFQAYVIFLGQEIPFETKCYIVNSMFVLWIWFCFVIRIEYQGNLVDGLQKFILEPRLGTLEEAVKVIPDFGGVGHLRAFIKEPKTRKNFKAVTVAESSQLIKDIGFGKRFLLYELVGIVTSNPYTLQMVDGSMIEFPTGLRVRAGWGAIHELAHILDIVAESGIMNKAVIDLTPRKIEIESGASRPLNMKDLQACFYCLLFMCGVCLLFFLVEIYIHARNSNKKSK